MHTVTVMVYDQAVSGMSMIFTAGKWSYNISLTDKDGTLWSGSGYGPTTSPGVVFARRFSVRRGDDGALRVYPQPEALGSSRAGDTSIDDWIRFYFGTSMPEMVRWFEQMFIDHGTTSSDFIYNPSDYGNVGSCY